MLYLHGGGFVVDAEGYDAPLRELAAATGHLIVAPHVRLAPEHPFPAAAEDAAAALVWLVTHLDELGACDDSLVVAGDSSGGNLAAGLVQNRQGLPISAQLLIYPMLDATCRSASYEYFATAEFDPLRDDGERYARQLHLSGVQVSLHRYKGTIHGFFQMTGRLSASMQLIHDCSSWLNDGRDAAPVADLSAST
jgi:acetyl esterase